MTILPKKKQNKEGQPSNDKTPDHQHSPHSPPSENRPGTRRPNSPPPRWNSPPPVELLEGGLPSHVDPGGLYEEYSPHEGTSNHNKRRHRSSPHRNVRKHRHDRHERSNPQWDLSRPHHNVAASSSSHAHRHPSFRPVASTSTDNSADLEELNNAAEELEGYNSGDEYTGRAPAEGAEKMEELERCFEKALHDKAGYCIKKMGEDGACLFRAVADQIYGDQEMHGIVRKSCVDYMAKNRDFFKPYVTEDFDLYLARKKLDHCHGNNIEMQAMCELYNRPIEVYQYSTEPINTFQTSFKSDYEPIRLSYHRNQHYNSVVNPRKATIGVGLGLPGYQPGLAETNQMRDATRVSEDFHLEQAMLEDKLRETDWEVTQESLEEQVARESYLQWLRDQEKSANNSSARSSSCSSSSTKARSASATCSTASDASAWWDEPSAATATTRSSHSPRSHTSSPCVSQSQSTSEEVGGAKGNSPKLLLPGPSTSPRPSSSSCHSPPRPHDLGGLGTAATGATAPCFSETASLMNELPPQLYGLSDWDEEDIMAQVMAQSQQEYLDSLKRTAGHSSNNPPISPPISRTPSHHSDSQASPRQPTHTQHDNS